MDREDAIKLRKTRRLSQREVAQEIKVSQSQYSLFEQGFVRLTEGQRKELKTLLESKTNVVYQD